MEPPYLGVKDVAQILGIDVSRVRQLAPIVPGAFKNSSGWQIPAAAIETSPLANRPKRGPKPKPWKTDKAGAEWLHIMQHCRIKETDMAIWQEITESDSPQRIKAAVDEILPAQSGEMALQISAWFKKWVQPCLDNAH